jgi:hypothetical protein
MWRRRLEDMGMSEQSLSERMREWMIDEVDKERFRQWLKEQVPTLSRADLRWLGHALVDIQLADDGSPTAVQGDNVTPFPKH